MLGASAIALVAIPVPSSATSQAASAEVPPPTLQGGRAGILLAGDEAVREARAAGADELVATLTLRSGTVVTVGADVWDPRGADRLAKAALGELASALRETPTAIPLAASNSFAVSADASRSRSDSAELTQLAESSTPLTFTEIRASAEFVASTEQLDADLLSATEPEISPQAAGDPKWWPEVFQAMSYTNSNGRVGKLAFYWSSAARNQLASYARSTFEPDFITYNYDRKYYFAKNITSWSTTMPNGYKDTNARDDENERVYTIGTSNAKNLKSGQTYQTVFITNAGNATTDKGKIVAQRGQHLVGCTSTWCIFAKGYARYFKNWGMTIPRASSWQSSGASFEQG